MGWRSKPGELYFRYTDENHPSWAVLATVAHGALSGWLSPQGSTPSIGLF